jgi:hypothetical protein
MIISRVARGPHAGRSRHAGEGKVGSKQSCLVTAWKTDRTPSRLNSVSDRHLTLLSGVKLNRQGVA